MSVSSSSSTYTTNHDDDDDDDEDNAREQEEEVFFRQDMRVFLRLRPMNKLEQSRRSKNCIDLQKDPTIVTIDSPLEGEILDYRFDHVFEEESSQEEVFDTALPDVAPMVLDGYNCTILAYGQTGTGKTHTMFGVNGEEEDGMMLRTVTSIFQELQQHSNDDSYYYTIRVSFIELYLEKIFDLLQPSNTNTTINEEGQLRGAAELCCLSVADVRAILARGQACRTMSRTQLNTESSKSHAMLRMTITQQPQESNDAATICSTLWMMDLAGSELANAKRLPRTSTTSPPAAQLTAMGATTLETDSAIPAITTSTTTNTPSESVMIHRSLNALVRMIKVQSSSKQRNQLSTSDVWKSSKLTRLLRPAFGGNCCTTVLLTASPSSYTISETMSTIQFGQYCRQIQNKPQLQKRRPQQCQNLDYKQLAKRIAQECLEPTTSNPNRDEALWEIIQELANDDEEEEEEAQSKDTATNSKDDKQQLLQQYKSQIEDLHSQVALLQRHVHVLQKEQSVQSESLHQAQQQVRSLSQRKLQVEHTLRTSQFRESEAISFLRQFRRFYRQVLTDRAAQSQAGTVTKILQPLNFDLGQLSDMDAWLVKAGLLEQEEENNMNNQSDHCKSEQSRKNPTAAESKEGTTAGKKASSKSKLPSKEALLQSSMAAQLAQQVFLKNVLNATHIKEEQRIEQEEKEADQTDDDDDDDEYVANRTTISKPLQLPGPNDEADEEEQHDSADAGAGLIHPSSSNDEIDNDNMNDEDIPSAREFLKHHPDPLMVGIDASVLDSLQLRSTNSSTSSTEHSIVAQTPATWICQQQRLVQTPSGRFAVLREEMLERDFLALTRHCRTLEQELDQHKALLEALQQKKSSSGGTASFDFGMASKQRLAQESISMRQALESKTASLTAIAWKMNELNLVRKTQENTMNNREQHILYLEEQLLDLQKANTILVQENAESDQRLLDQMEELQQIVRGMMAPLWQLEEYNNKKNGSEQQQPRHQPSLASRLIVSSTMNATIETDEEEIERVRRQVTGELEHELAAEDAAVLQSCESSIVTHQDDLIADGNGDDDASVNNDAANATKDSRNNRPPRWPSRRQITSPDDDDDNGKQKCNSLPPLGPRNHSLKKEEEGPIIVNPQDVMMDLDELIAQQKQKVADSSDTASRQMKRNMSIGGTTITSVASVSANEDHRTSSMAAYQDSKGTSNDAAQERLSASIRRLSVEQYDDLSTEQSEPKRPKRHPSSQQYHRRRQQVHLVDAETQTEPQDAEQDDDGESSAPLTHDKRSITNDAFRSIWKDEENMESLHTIKTANLDDYNSQIDAVVHDDRMEPLLITSTTSYGDGDDQSATTLQDDKVESSLLISTANYDDDDDQGYIVQDERMESLLQRSTRKDDNNDDKRSDAMQEERRMKSLLLKSTTKDSDDERSVEASSAMEDDDAELFSGAEEKDASANGGDNALVATNNTLDQNENRRMTASSSSSSEQKLNSDDYEKESQKLIERSQDMIIDMTKVQTNKRQDDDHDVSYCSTRSAASKHTAGSERIIELEGSSDIDDTAKEERISPIAHEDLATSQLVSNDLLDEESHASTVIQVDEVSSDEGSGTSETAAAALYHGKEKEVWRNPAKDDLLQQKTEAQSLSEPLESVLRQNDDENEPVTKKIIHVTDDDLSTNSQIILENDSSSFEEPDNVDAAIEQTFDYKDDKLPAISASPVSPKLITDASTPATAVPLLGTEGPQQNANGSKEAEYEALILGKSSSPTNLTPSHSEHMRESIKSVSTPDSTNSATYDDDDEYDLIDHVEKSLQMKYNSDYEETKETRYQEEKSDDQSSFQGKSSSTSITRLSLNDAGIHNDVEEDYNATTVSPSAIYDETNAVGDENLDRGSNFIETEDASRAFIVNGSSIVNKSQSDIVSRFLPPDADAKNEGSAIGNDADDHVNESIVHSSSSTTSFARFLPRGDKTSSSNFSIGKDYDATNSDAKDSNNASSSNMLSRYLLQGEKTHNPSIGKSDDARNSDAKDSNDDSSILNRFVPQDVRDKTKYDNPPNSDISKYGKKRNARLLENSDELVLWQTPQQANNVALHDSDDYDNLGKKWDLTEDEIAADAAILGSVPEGNRYILPPTDIPNKSTNNETFNGSAENESEDRFERGLFGNDNEKEPIQNGNEKSKIEADDDLESKNSDMFFDDYGDEQSDYMDEDRTRNEIAPEISNTGDDFDGDDFEMMMNETTAALGRFVDENEGRDECNKSKDEDRFEHAAPTVASTAKEDIEDTKDDVEEDMMQIKTVAYESSDEDPYNSDNQETTEMDGRKIQPSTELESENAHQDRTDDDDDSFDHLGDSLLFVGGRPPYYQPRRSVPKFSIKPAIPQRTEHSYPDDADEGSIQSTSKHKNRELPSMSCHSSGNSSSNSSSRRRKRKDKERRRRRRREIEEMMLKGEKRIRQTETRHHDDENPLSQQNRKKREDRRKRRKEIENMILSGRWKDVEELRGEESSSSRRRRDESNSSRRRRRDERSSSRQRGGVGERTATRTRDTEKRDKKNAAKTSSRRHRKDRTLEDGDAARSRSRRHRRRRGVENGEKIGGDDKRSQEHQRRHSVGHDEELRSDKKDSSRRHRKRDKKPSCRREEIDSSRHSEDKGGRTRSRLRHRN